MPLRDDRRGRRATVGFGKSPLRPEFSSVGATTPLKPGVPPSEGAPSSEPSVNASDASTIASDASATSSDTSATDTFAKGGRPDDALPSDGSNASSDDGEADRNGSSFDEAHPRSLLEPSAALMAIVRPFLRIGSAILRFASLPIVGSRSVPMRDIAIEDSRPAAVVERSFASEVASLLDASSDVVTLPDRLPETSATSDRAATPPAFDDAETATAASPADVAASSERSAQEQSPPEEQSTVLPWIEAPANAEAVRRYDSQNVEPSEAPEEDGAGRMRDAVARDEYDSDAFNLDAPGIRCADGPEQNVVVARVPNRQERAVPITRLPLRPQGFEITWTAEVPDFERARSVSRTARHALLERLVRNPGSVTSEAIARAYRQEDGEGRVIALRVLLRNFPQAGKSAFVEALRVGSDEERALAVDGLAAIGARDEMTPAFSDRVEAIAAKAALSYVGTLARADYRAELSAFIDETQIEAILKLLAGIVE